MLILFHNTTVLTVALVSISDSFKNINLLLVSFLKLQSQFIVIELLGKLIMVIGELFEHASPELHL